MPGKEGAVSSSARRIEGDGIGAGRKRGAEGGRQADGGAGRGRSQIAVLDQCDRRCVRGRYDRVARGRIGVSVGNGEQVAPAPAPVAAPVTSVTTPALPFALIVAVAPDPAADSILTVGAAVSASTILRRMPSAAVK